MNESIYCVGGEAPVSGLFEIKSGVNTENDVSEHILGSIKFDE